MAHAGRRAQVDAERGLTVGARGHQLEPTARVEQAGAETDDEISARIAERHRRHVDERVLGQQRDQGVQVGRLPGPGELRYQRAFGRRVRRGRRFSPGDGQLTPSQGGAASLEGAVDRLDRRVHHLGHLAGAVAEDVAQDDDGELPGRQHL